MKDINRHSIKRRQVNYLGLALFYYNNKKYLSILQIEAYAVICSICQNTVF